MKIISTAVESDGRRGVVIVEAATPEEVTSVEAKELAIGAVAGRMTRAGLSASPQPYPVDADGASEPLLSGRPGQIVAAYRCDFELAGMP